jgi:hypothetical protein
VLPLALSLSNGQPSNSTFAVNERNEIVVVGKKTLLRVKQINESWIRVSAASQGQVSGGGGGE